MGWFGHVEGRQAKAPVRQSFAMQVYGPPRERGSPKRTWMEVIIIDLKKCNLSKDLALDISKWRKRIHVAGPNIVGTRHG